MDAQEELTGRRLHIVIEEDGTAHPPELPPGTVSGAIPALDGTLYHVIRLDHAVTCLRAANGEYWTLRELVVAPRFQGDSLASVWTTGGHDVAVGVANLLVPSAQTDGPLDFRGVAYFAIGWARRESSRTPR